MKHISARTVAIVTTLIALVTAINWAYHGFTRSDGWVVALNVLTSAFWYRNERGLRDWRRGPFEERSHYE